MLEVSAWLPQPSSADPGATKHNQHQARPCRAAQVSCYSWPSVHSCFQPVAALQHRRPLHHHPALWRTCRQNERGIQQARAPSALRRAKILCRSNSSSGLLARNVRGADRLRAPRRGPGTPSQLGVLDHAGSPWIHLDRYLRGLVPLRWPRLRGVRTRSP
jgi:hypothetical protein